MVDIKNVEEDIKEKVKNVGDDIKEKGHELKKWFMGLDAKMEQWKFSVEDTEEGTRMEVHATALIKHSSDKK
jgi:hypothetical protein